MLESMALEPAKHRLLRPGQWRAVDRALVVVLAVMFLVFGILAAAYGRPRHAHVTPTVTVTVTKTVTTSK